MWSTTKANVSPNQVLLEQIQIIPTIAAWKVQKSSRHSFDLYRNIVKKRFCTIMFWTETRCYIGLSKIEGRLFRQSSQTCPEGFEYSPSSSLKSFSTCLKSPLEALSDLCWMVSLSLTQKFRRIAPKVIEETCLMFSEDFAWSSRRSFCKVLLWNSRNFRKVLG